MKYYQYWFPFSLALIRVLLLPVIHCCSFSYYQIYHHTIMHGISLPGSIFLYIISKSSGDMIHRLPDEFRLSKKPILNLPISVIPGTWSLNDSISFSFICKGDVKVYVMPCHVSVFASLLRDGLMMTFTV